MASDEEAILKWNTEGQMVVEVDVLKELQWQTSEELDALLPAILDRALKGEL